MATGTVKWFDEQRGFGYIQAAEGGPDVFVHRSVLDASGVGRLDEGEAVEFETEATNRGPRALRVRRSDTSAS